MWYIGIVGLIVFVCALFFIEWLINYFHRKGAFLSKNIKPYYEKVMDLTRAFSNSEFVKTMPSQLRTILTDLNNTYNSFSKSNSLHSDDVCKIVIESSNNTDIIYIFALMYIISHKTGAVLAPTHEEILAENTLKEDCKKQLKNFFNEVPIEFWDYFNLARLYHDWKDTTNQRSE